ncbi:DUF1801 domain-containing protein [Cellulophaga baltica]|uniref:DUF1801 domain-containing protein n=1 Tax=Cellulophaga baltica TaxID=76594 RepID=UPI00214810C3|nr:DUF1801 domain-containing protein [Cellulophaga baltica]MCR1026373.1 DUF1801 domain-containing protein [Cellulophaga baltica]
MKQLLLLENPKVALVFEGYPDLIRPKMRALRNLILEAANELDDVQELEETLKWGEPSYIAKKGSTIRIDWKKKTPEHYAIYFKCTSLLVITFKEVFPDQFTYEGNRALVFKVEEEIPVKELKSCIKAALQYHTIKHVPSLGM